MAINQLTHVDGEQFAFSNDQLPINDRKVNLINTAQKKRRRRIVNCAACQAERVEVDPNKIGSLARLQRANFICPSQYSRAAACGQAHPFFD